MGKIFRRPSLVQKPDAALTASSYYSETVNTISAQPLSTAQLPNTPLRNDDQTVSIADKTITNDSHNKTPIAEISLSTTDSSANDHNNSAVTFDSEVSKRNSKSMLRRSLSILSRKEEKQSSSLLKVHRYTIYDDEKGEFIEIIEEEWEGDGPPPRKSTSDQQTNALMIDKDLPQLPELIENNTREETMFLRFYKWLEDRYPFILEFSKKHKKTLLISLGLFFLLILIIIILACTL
ncbi:7719_t:CDS:1 [Acaulospora morrowiae]|uniref:7719_t:CDS:1 n=1 Tax=Acaulospora morrowiae TaxID=94023 RepID=A0A9N9AYV7_9GLOM|nr:7719_t:CDS:1 [Acaulospora morrowiae]